jgi:hypothetical protein
MRTTKNTKNSEYRVIKNGAKYEVWLVSMATGAILKCVAKHLGDKESANEFKEWVKGRE